MLRYGFLAGALFAFLTLGNPAPAAAHGFCSGPIGGGICGAGIGGGIGAAFGSAGTGAIIGGAIGLTSGLHSPGSCNYRRCSATYRSFRASDCTFQPYRGHRRYCRR